MAEAEAHFLDRPKIPAVTSEFREKSSADESTKGREDKVSNSQLLLGVPGNRCQANGKIPHEDQNFLMKTKCKKKQRNSSAVFSTRHDEFACEKARIGEVVDNPYSDIDSVPQIRRCPKGGGRPSLNSTTDHPVRQFTSQHEKDAKKNIEVQGGLWFSKAGKGQTSGVFSRAGIKSVNCSFGKVSCKIKIPESASMKSRDNQITGSEQQSVEAKKSLDKRVACLPASSRLMTRALKAMEDARLQQPSSQDLKPSLPSGESESDVRCVSKVKAARQKILPGPDLKAGVNSDAVSKPSLDPSDSQDNEVAVKSEDESCVIPSGPVVFNASELKKENQLPEASVLSTASPFRVNIQGGEDMKEITFKSLENKKNGKSTTFRPDANYKYSTFLMLLKDIHDSREKDGRPLVMEPLPTKKLIKEEPSMSSEKEKKSSFGHVKDDKGNRTLPGHKKYGQSKTSCSKSKQNKTNAKFGPDMRDANGFVVPQCQSIPSVAKSVKKTTKRSQHVIKKSLNNVFVPSELSRKSDNTQTPRFKGLTEDSESSFFGSVPKKRWQKFEQDNEKALNAEVRNDQGPKQPEMLPSEQKNFVDPGVEKTNSATASATETPVNPASITPNTCEVSSFPTGKMSARRNVIRS